MKLIRYGQPRQEKPGLVDKNGIYRDLSDIVSDWNGTTLGQQTLINKISDLNWQELPEISATERIGAPLAGIGKLICIGYNSKLHAEQMGTVVTAEMEPIVFLKATSAICGPNDPILYNQHTPKIDWEGELAIVIGKQGKYIPAELAADYIFGYMCGNDLSERYWQFETNDKQFTRGKSFDNFAPLGPYLVTSDEIGDPDNLRVKLSVNGITRQDFFTSDYIRNPAIIVSYLSKFFTLYPADVILLGSPPGNAKSWGDNFWLKPGDIVELEIYSLGKQRQVVITE